jgi:hypothetical protein
MVKLGIAIIILKNREDKYDNEEYETKGIYRLYVYMLTLKNE